MAEASIRGHGAAVVLRGRTASGVTLAVPDADWRDELGLSAVEGPADDSTLAPVDLRNFAARTRRALHILSRNRGGLVLSQIVAALDPDAGETGSLRNALLNLVEAGLLRTSTADACTFRWHSTPLGRVTAAADLRRNPPVTPREMLAAVRAMTARVHPQGLARWWPVEHAGHSAPPVTLASLVRHFFALDIDQIGPAGPRLTAGLDQLVAQGHLITLTARRGKSAIPCYWPAKGSGD